MAITDIDISEELMTNAPSIKYRGDEGPKSPQEEQMMMADAILEEEYNKYVFDLLEIRPEATPMTIEEFRQMVIAEGQMSGGQPLPQDPTKPVNPFGPKPQGPVLPDRQMAAYGGIMGLDGRKQYGIGSSLKKFVRKVIPNEVSEIAVKAAPFVAPFNPLAAGLMSGIGGFDQTGRIGSSLKSGLMNYGLGQASRYLGGAGFQGAPEMLGGSGLGGTYGFSSPLGTETGIGKFLDSRRPANLGASGADKAAFTSDAAYSMPDQGLIEVPGEGIKSSIVDVTKKVGEEQSKNILGDLPKLIKDNLSKVGLGNNLVTGLLAGGLGASALMGNMEPDEIQNMQRGEGLDIEGIRTEVIEAMKDPSGDALKAIRIKYPFLGNRDTKDIEAMGKAMGGRIGFENGGLTEYEAYRLKNMGYDTKGGTVLEPFGGIGVLKDILRVNKANGGRMNMKEGGIMDLGGMEKDYRAEGGFVPIGREEKADDVPARLSVNEFVFTADAVRNAGGGDIDQGAQVMENMMKHLEQGGQVSEESQGMQGARDMFATSERLSEVI